MEIAVSSTTGLGLTELSAFDNALFNLGVGDHNIVHLSSVIPLHAVITRTPIDLNGQFQGDRIYGVYAKRSTDTRGMSVAAGLGWVTTKTDPAWGLFVEHVGHTESEIIEQIENSLTSMMQYRNEYTWSAIESEVVTATCEETPVCALALAVYQRESW